MAKIKVNELEKMTPSDGDTLLASGAEKEYALKVEDLKEGDIITSIDNIELNTMNDLREYIYTKKPNDSVSLKINRGKINKEIIITLGKK